MGCSVLDRCLQRDINVNVLNSKFFVDGYGRALSSDLSTSVGIQVSDHDTSSPFFGEDKSTGSTYTASYACKILALACVY